MDICKTSDGAELKTTCVIEGAKTGLRVESALDTRSYEKGIKVTDAQMEALDIKGDAFHPEWNYTIRPRTKLANRST